MKKKEKPRSGSYMTLYGYIIHELPDWWEFFLEDGMTPENSDKI